MTQFASVFSFTMSFIVAMAADTHNELYLVIIHLVISLLFGYAGYLFFTCDEDD